MFLNFLLAICPFCNPAVIERQLVAETDKSLVLYCLTPATDGNVMIIPKRHIERFDELEDEEMADLYHLIQKVQTVFKKHYGLTDYVLLQKTGKNSGATVDHIHIHAIPCYEGFDPGVAFRFRARISPEEMQESSSSLRPYFED